MIRRVWQPIFQSFIFRSRFDHLIGTISRITPFSRHGTGCHHLYIYIIYKYASSIYQYVAIGIWQHLYVDRQYLYVNSSILGYNIYILIWQYVY